MQGRFERRRSAAAALVAGALLALACSGGSGDGSEGSAGYPRVAVIGIDGATFDVIDPLLEEGRLPNLKRFIERGVRAPLRSLGEDAVSPAVWTTVATGRLPGTHGIRGFQRAGVGDPVLVSAADRRSLALWNIAGAHDRSSGVIGWWVTWPAEPVRGFVVSDRVAHSRFQAWNDGKKRRHLTYPPELQEEIAPLVVDPRRDPPIEELRRLANLTPEEVERLRAAERPVLFHWLSVYKSGYCEQRTYERIAFHMLERGQPDLLFLLLIAVDPISHTFWHFHEPEAFGGEVDPETARRLGAVIPNIYAHNDRVLGRLLERLGPETAILVVSDHGFGPSGRLPKPSRWVRPRAGVLEQVERPLNVGQSGSHRRDGVLVAAGGPIRPGATPRAQPEVADVAPTVLALLGLPVARDMPGRVLTELIDPEFLRKHPIRYVDTYEGRVPAPPIPEPGEEGLDQPRLEYLRALGYLDE